MESLLGINISDKSETCMCAFLSFFLPSSCISVTKRAAGRHTYKQLVPHPLFRCLRCRGPHRDGSDSQQHTEGLIIARHGGIQSAERRSWSSCRSHALRYSRSHEICGHMPALPTPMIVKSSRLHQHSTARGAAITVCLLSALADARVTGV